MLGVIVVLLVAPLIVGRELCVSLRAAKQVVSGVALDRLG